VEHVDQTVLKVISDLWDSLYDSPGVGLAAPQIGVPLQISVIDIKRSKSPKDQITLINPELILGEGVQVPREGCLSVPDWLANVRRYAAVKVQSDGIDGEKRVIEARGFKALALQHEIDHLAGRLFIDRVVDLKTDVFRRKSY
jgi:peptide deformylase